MQHDGFLDQFIIMYESWENCTSLGYRDNAVALPILHSTPKYAPKIKRKNVADSVPDQYTK